MCFSDCERERERERERGRGRERENFSSLNSADGRRIPFLALDCIVLFHIIRSHTCSNRGRHWLQAPSGTHGLININMNKKKIKLRKQGTLQPRILSHGSDRDVKNAAWKGVELVHVKTTFQNCGGIFRRGAHAPRAPHKLRPWSLHVMVIFSANRRLLRDKPPSVTHHKKHDFNPTNMIETTVGGVSL